MTVRGGVRALGWTVVVLCGACGGPTASGASDAGRDARVDAPPARRDAGDASDAKGPVAPKDAGPPRDATRPELDASVRDASASQDAPSITDASHAVDAGPCPSGTVLVGTFCIDTWEAFVVEVDDAGVEHPHSPYDVVDDLVVRAKTAAHVVPQGYISQIEATGACELAGKRLCSEDEFHLACRGPDASNYYPYGGETDIPGYCNEGKGSYVELLYGDDPSTWTYDDFNDPRLNQIDGGLAATQSYPHCRSPFGIYDCMGNLHEWGDDPPDSEGHGRFRGGFYGDAEENGPGCLYVTSAHDVSYHDYSTGFRCCADIAGGG